ncbi:MAG: polyribonucleotide nucleotidyltransferase [Puniceicoccales bacterium]|jgi:polyribonucleotide nucleotidyltransferase|nr:polyribonucleotide nucleotidyltransferase [Puniceicoccales bacterium]
MNHKYEVTVDEFSMKLSAGTFAKQANGAVWISSGETTILVTATVSSVLNKEQDFFPLSVDYREKFSAAGRMPGGYNKREGRPSEKEVLTARMCDRPLRPLFPRGFFNEVQVMGTLYSTDLKNEADILMINGASAALMCSDIPWNGPIGCVRIGEIGGEFVASPTNEQMFSSTLDLIYVGNERNMMMIEGNADQVTEERLIEALEFGQKRIQPIIAAQRKLAEMVGKKKKNFELILAKGEIVEICATFGDKLRDALFRSGKLEREEAVREIKDEAKAAIVEKLGECEFCGISLNMAFEELQERLYRDNILDNCRRVDGRGLSEVRPIECAVDVLPIVHGSSLFQRGETQTLVSLTLGCSDGTQEIDAITGGVQSKSFYLHYNFPPFSVGETGRIGTVGRREIGHGALAERSLSPVIPAEDAFPYSIRVVSDVLESNGSSSMASVCGGCLALMDAGVPITDTVAGISIGLVTKSSTGGAIEKHVVLTDIIGTEDHFGDMDFKLSGTRKGITGVQLDLKIHGLPIEIAKEAIMRGRDARIKIIDTMESVISEPRDSLKPNAPKIHSMQIDPDRIGALIGPGGKNIKRITEITGARIDINEDSSGKLVLFAPKQESLDFAIREVELICCDIEPGKVYRGKVTSIKEFGVFVECLPGKEGLVHVSEMADFRVDDPADICKIGDEIIVKCVGFDEKGRVRLSRRAVICEAKGIPYEATTPRSSGSGERRGRPGGGGERSGGRFPSGGDREKGRGNGRDPRNGGGERGRDHSDRGDRGDRREFRRDRRGN